MVGHVDLGRSGDECNLLVPSHSLVPTRLVLVKGRLGNLYVYMRARHPINWHNINGQQLHPLHRAMASLPFLGSYEQSFSTESAIEWMENNWVLSIYVGAIYLTLVFVGRQWMKPKPSWNLQRPLLFWNTGLAIFSALGSLKFLPVLIDALATGGMGYSVCYTPLWSTPHLCLWLFLFCLSKAMELGDTAFLVLRKSPLTFLHWYHHVTVMFYAWYGFTGMSAVANWFCTMNYVVHTFMYTYFAVRAYGYRIPNWIAQTITILQLMQFFLGLYTNFLAYYMKRSGVKCALDENTFHIGMVIYGTYFLLFLNFFYNRYLKKKKV